MASRPPLDRRATYNASPMPRPGDKYTLASSRILSRKPRSRSAKATRFYWRDQHGSKIATTTLATSGQIAPVDIILSSSARYTLYSYDGYEQKPLDAVEVLLEFEVYHAIVPRSTSLAFAPYLDTFSRSHSRVEQTASSFSCRIYGKSTHPLRNENHRWVFIPFDGQEPLGRRDYTRENMEHGSEDTDWEIRFPMIFSSRENSLLVSGSGWCMWQERASSGVWTTPFLIVVSAYEIEDLRLSASDMVDFYRSNGKKTDIIQSYVGDPDYSHRAFAAQDSGWMTVAPSSFLHSTEQVRRYSGDPVSLRLAHAPLHWFHDAVNLDATKRILCYLERKPKYYAPFPSRYSPIFFGAALQISVQKDLIMALPPITLRLPFLPMGPADRLKNVHWRIQIDAKNGMGAECKKETPFPSILLTTWSDHPLLILQRLDDGHLPTSFSNVYLLPQSVRILPAESAFSGTVTHTSTLLLSPHLFSIPLNFYAQFSLAPKEVRGKNVAPETFEDISAKLGSSNDDDKRPRSKMPKILLLGAALRKEPQLLDAVNALYSRYFSLENGIALFIDTFYGGKTPLEAEPETEVRDARNKSRILRSLLNRLPYPAFEDFLKKESWNDTGNIISWNDNEKQCDAYRGCVFPEQDRSLHDHSDTLERVSDIFSDSWASPLPLRRPRNSQELALLSRISAVRDQGSWRELMELEQYANLGCVLTLPYVLGKTSEIVDVFLEDRTPEVLLTDAFIRSIYSDMVQNNFARCGAWKRVGILMARQHCKSTARWVWIMRQLKSLHLFTNANIASPIKPAPRPSSPSPPSPSPSSPPPPPPSSLPSSTFPLPDNRGNEIPLSSESLPPAEKTPPGSSFTIRSSIRDRIPTQEDLFSPFTPFKNSLFTSTKPIPESPFFEGEETSNVFNDVFSPSSVDITNNTSNVDINNRDNPERDNFFEEPELFNAEETEDTLAKSAEILPPENEANPEFRKEVEVELESEAEKEAINEYSHRLAYFRRISALWPRELLPGSAYKSPIRYGSDEDVANAVKAWLLGFKEYVHIVHQYLPLDISKTYSAEKDPALVYSQEDSVETLARRNKDGASALFAAALMSALGVAMNIPFDKREFLFYLLNIPPIIVAKDGVSFNVLNADSFSVNAASVLYIKENTILFNSAPIVSFEEFSLIARLMKDIYDSTSYFLPYNEENAGEIVPSVTVGDVRNHLNTTVRFGSPGDLNSRGNLELWDDLTNRANALAGNLVKACNEIAKRKGYAGGRSESTVNSSVLSSPGTIANEETDASVRANVRIQTPIRKGAANDLPLSPAKKITERISWDLNESISMREAISRYDFLEWIRDVQEMLRHVYDEETLNPIDGSGLFAFLLLADRIPSPQNQHLSIENIHLVQMQYVRGMLYVLKTSEASLGSNDLFAFRRNSLEALPISPDNPSAVSTEPIVSKPVMFTVISAAFRSVSQYQERNVNKEEEISQEISFSNLFIIYREMKRFMDNTFADPDSAYNNRLSSLPLLHFIPIILPETRRDTVAATNTSSPSRKPLPFPYRSWNAVFDRIAYFNLIILMRNTLILPPFNRYQSREPDPEKLYNYLLDNETVTSFKKILGQDNALKGPNKPKDTEHPFSFKQFQTIIERFYVESENT